jgi:hypothetical protein
MRSRAEILVDVNRRSGDSGHLHFLRRVKLGGFNPLSVLEETA